MFLETKNKIKCIDAPKNALTYKNPPESEKYIWIIQNVHEKLRLFYIIESRATTHPVVSAFTETVEFLKRSLVYIAAAGLAVSFSHSAW